MRRLLTILVGVLILLFIVAVLGVLGLYKSGFHPVAETLLDVEQGAWAAGDPPAGRSKGVRILFLNLNHGLGRETIWYERTPPLEVSPDAQAIGRRLDAAAALVREQKADAVVLQEVDFGSRATGGVDQAETLARRLGWAHVARARTQASPYPLFPEPLRLNVAGPIDTGVAVLSPRPIVKSVLFPLPAVESRSWLEDAFGPHAVVHETRVEMVEGQVLKILHVVLDAEDPSAREKQASAAADWIDTRDHNDAVVFVTTWSEPFRRPRSPEEAEAAGRLEYTMDLLRYKGAFRDTVDDRTFLADPAPHGTWMEVGSDQPSRRFDVVLLGKGIETWRLEVQPPAPDLSDHVPMLVTLDLP